MGIMIQILAGRYLGFDCLLRQLQCDLIVALGKCAVDKVECIPTPPGFAPIAPKFQSLIR